MYNFLNLWGYLKSQGLYVFTGEAEGNRHPHTSLIQTCIAQSSLATVVGDTDTDVLRSLAAGWVLVI